MHAMSRKKSTEIKAFMFDLGKVVLDFDFKPAFKRLSKASGLTPEEVREFFMRSGLEVLYDGGKLSSREFYRQVKRSLRHNLSFLEFKYLWNHVFIPHKPVIQLIRKLRTHYRLVLISNTNAMHYRYIRKTYTVLEHFDRIILSFREKIRKPDARIYRKAALACRAKPHEIFYIDDREDLTQSAKALGFHTFTYRKNPHELTQAMRSLGIRGVS